jgi:hypothetical protein
MRVNDLANTERDHILPQYKETKTEGDRATAECNRATANT